MIKRQPSQQVLKLFDSMVYVEETQEKSYKDIIEDEVSQGEESVGIDLGRECDVKLEQKSTQYKTLKELFDSDDSSDHKVKKEDEEDEDEITEEENVN